MSLLPNMKKRMYLYRFELGFDLSDTCPLCSKELTWIDGEARHECPTMSTKTIFTRR